jgi:hypothetical protein
MIYRIRGGKERDRKELNGKVLKKEIWQKTKRKKERKTW